MLFVIRTQAAVVGAAVVGAGLDAERPVAGLQPILLRLPVVKIIADQGLLNAMVPAPLEVEDVSAFGDDLRRNESETGLTQARGLTEEQVGRDLARCRRRFGRGDSRAIHRRPIPGRECGRC